MAARDNAASVQGEVARITPLNLDGTIDESRPILTTEGFISASFSSDFEDGDEITEKAANGKICIQYKADDSMKGITFNLSLCSPDPEASAVIAGGWVILNEDDEVVGYSSPAVGSSVGNPVAIEIWSKAIINGKPAPGDPYWHWVFPYVRVRYDGDREFSNGALSNEFSGSGVGNDALVTAGLNPETPTDDFVVYKTALSNPFSYVRSAELPALGWSTATWNGGGIGPSGYISPIGEVPSPLIAAPTPGSTVNLTTLVPPLTGWDPPTMDNDHLELIFTDPSPTTAWTSGQEFTLIGDDGATQDFYWAGPTNQWQQGSAP